MTTFLLVRHAAHALGPRTLAGTLPGVGLSDDGRAQLRALADRLRALPLDAVYASPLERTRETAGAIARGLPVRVREGLREVDYGDWTGRSVDSLDGDPAWHEWNERRATARVPGGESMREVQDRVLAELDAIGHEWPRGTVAVVTHAEVVRTVLAHERGVPLDDCLSIDVAPASIHVLTRQPLSAGEWAGAGDS